MEWRKIHTFNNYSVSDEGLVRNDDTGRIMRQSVNQSGVVHVGLTKNKIQYKRATALLVANAFVRTARTLSFNTPVNLNGDRLDNHACNLVWRPRWFATRYFDQFEVEPVVLPNPVEDVKTREWFETSWDAAISFGIMHIDLIMAIANDTRVWPTFQRFRQIR